MTSGNIFPQRLTKIDELSRPDHSYLASTDDCYFIGEYTARKGFAFSAGNSLILNFKKKMDRRGRPEWAYKIRAIEQAAAALRGALKEEARGMLTFVPVPPSKARADPLYDDRLTEMLRLIWPGLVTDIREVVVQPVSTEAVHDHEDRPSPADLEARYVIDRACLQPAPRLIAITDDVLTTGAHFVAVRNKLQSVYPGIPMFGLFIARRVPEAVDFDAFDT